MRGSARHLYLGDDIVRTLWKHKERLNMINREGYWVTETERECTSCGKHFPRTSKTVTLCNECNSERVKCSSVEWKMHQRAKARSKKSNKLFDLQVSDIVIPTVCPVLGVPLEMHKGSSGGRSNSPALDRIDNNKGYTKDNIQVISHRANVMKADASKEELIAFAKWVLETFVEE